MRALVARVRAAGSIQVLEGVRAVGLQTREGVVTGVELALSGPQHSQRFLIERTACLLAGGASLHNMTATTILIAASALVREESRGGHYRAVFPELDARHARRSRMTLDEALRIAVP